MQKQVIIDCDPGVDDALAIILALHHPSMQVKAICSVTGNGDLEKTTANGLRILTLTEREDIPLYKGSGYALDETKPEEVPAFGDDGLGGFASSIPLHKKPEPMDAVEYLVKAVDENPHKLSILAIGPLTNIAKACRKDKDFSKKTKEIIIMGGAKSGGNMSPVAEYNFWADPLAAKEVLEAGFQNLVMVGLDVTNPIALEADIREIIRNTGTPVASFIYNITQYGLDDNWRLQQIPVSPMHDVLAAAYLIDPSVLTTQKSHIQVLTEGAGRGQSIVDLNGYWSNGACNAQFATDVDQGRFYELFLTTTCREQEDFIKSYLHTKYSSLRRK